ncbi:MAG: hypothetical protein CSA62_12370 [Planctomycetota bacterium]|nr:MAG: hypothetical protein CSA62_12370 [Planctomycetota bacterium]
MKDTLSGIVSMLEEGNPEQRVAAAQVLTWLRPKAPAVVKALANAAEHGDRFLKSYAVEALAEIGNNAAHSALIPRLHFEGPLRAKVVRAFSKRGSSIEPLLIKEFEKAAPETQEVLLGILAMTRGEEALGFLIQCIKDEEQVHTGRTAARLLLAALQELDAEENAEEFARLHDYLLKVVKGLGKKTGDEIRAQLLRLLVELADESCKSVFLSASGSSKAPEVRCEGLRGLARGIHLAPAETRTILGYLKEPDFLHVVGPALEVLADVQFSGSPAATVLGHLLESDRPEVRLFAIEKLGDFATASSAKLLLPFLDNDDERVRLSTSKSLGKNPAALDALVKKFYAGRDLEEASRPIDALVQLAEELKPAQLRKMAQRFLALFEAEDPVRELCHRVLAAAPVDKVCKVVLKETIKLREAGRLRLAFALLEILPGDIEKILDPDLHYERAVLLLLLRGEAEPSHREGDPVVGLLRVLIDADHDVLKRLKQEKQLSADQFLYLGERFLQHLNKERRFGQELLHWLIENDSDSKAAVQAVQKLKLEGLL